MESADITLVRDVLRLVPEAVWLSQVTFRNIKQNPFFAFFYNSLGIPIAAGVLYPVIHTLLNPAIAAAAMAFSSVSVVMNALRLPRYEPVGRGGARRRRAGRKQAAGQPRSLDTRGLPPREVGGSSDYRTAGGLSC
jgi:hypothetical protein